MVTTIPEIAAVTDFASQGKRIYHEIFVLAEEDIDYSTLPTITETDAARTMAALTLKTSAPGWKKFAAAKNTAAHSAEGTSGDITSSANETLTLTLAGESDAIDNFLQTVGRPVLLCIRDRFSGDLTILGRPYSPLRFSAFSRRKNGDNTSADVTFTRETLQMPLKYLGSVTGSTTTTGGGGSSVQD